MSHIYDSNFLKFSRRLFFLGLLVVLASCTKIKDLLNPPTPRELYSREFDERNSDFNAWERAYQESYKDSLLMFLPYQETGNFSPDEITVYSYNMDLERGEVFQFEISVDSINTRVFVDFLRQTDDSLNSYELISQRNSTERHFQFNVQETDTYKITIQPELGANTPFELISYTMPSYIFPVSGYTSSAIQSFWGAPRDAGRRQHEGVDIFAPRGTPVIAATDGRIRYTGERGLGGKQVWLRTNLFGGNSLYYAHLDSIADVDGHVEEGDTLGFIGNTGNARTTPPHLHFGIYARNGAVNPLPFVQEGERPNSSISTQDQSTVVVHSTYANLRLAASLSGQKIGEAVQGDTLQVLGITEDWHHIRTENNLRAYIHKSLID